MSCCCHFILGRYLNVCFSGLKTNLGVEDKNNFQSLSGHEVLRVLGVRGELGLGLDGDEQPVGQVEKHLPLFGHLQRLEPELCLAHDVLDRHVGDGVVVVVHSFERHLFKKLTSKMQSVTDAFDVSKKISSMSNNTGPEKTENNATKLQENEKMSNSKNKDKNLTKQKNDTEAGKTIYD